MKRIPIFILLALLLFAGCAGKERKSSGYDSLVQTFIDATYGHSCPTRETVESLRHRTMRGDNYDAFVESWKENNAVLKEVFGENYTYSVKILSSAGDIKAMENIQKFLNTQLTYDDGYVKGYYVLELEITFSGNGKTYVAEGKLDVISSDQWYTVNSLLESVNNFQ